MEVTHILRTSTEEHVILSKIKTSDDLHNFALMDYIDARYLGMISWP